MKNSIQKCLAGVLTAVLLTVLGGCIAVDSQPTEMENSPITLHVLMNAPSMHSLDGTTGTYSLYDEVRRVVQAYNQSHEDVTVELEVLPTDAEERELRAQQLRTEIMAGGGPDIYIMTDWPPIDQVNGDVHFITNFPADDTVFRDVAMSMRNGLFYDISDYYDDDSDIGRDSLVISVMDGGKVGDARYVLPLRYTYPVIFADKTALDASGMDVDTMKASVSGFYSELLKKGDRILAQCAAWPVYHYPFFAFFNLIDYDAQTITLRVEDVADYMQNLQSLVVLAGNVGNSRSSLTEEIPIVFGDLERASSLVYAAENQGIEVEAFPLRSMEGQLIAYIKTWGAISSACTHPDAAYEFLREFLLADSQWETNRNGETDYIEGTPVRPAAVESEIVNALLWTPVDQARFTIKEEYIFEYTALQALYDVTNNMPDLPDGVPLPDDFQFIYTVSDMDIGAAAQKLIDDLRYHMAEG